MRYTLSSLIVMAMLAAAPGIACAADSIAVIGMLEGSASATDSSGAVRALKVGDPVYLDEEIATAATSKLQIMLKDKSSVMLNANSKLAVREFAYDATSHDGKLALQEMKGAFRFIGGALSKKNPVTIETPVSSIGIRGGVGDTFIAENGATDTVFIYGKAMSMTNADGQTVTTTSYGSGLSMATSHDLPATMAPDLVQQRLTTFGSTAPAPSKEAAPEPKTSSDVAPEKKDKDTTKSSDTEKKSDAASTTEAPAGQTKDSSSTSTVSSGETQPAASSTSAQTPAGTSASATADVATTASQTSTKEAATTAQTNSAPLKGILVTTSGPTGNVTMRADKLALQRDTATGGGDIYIGQRGLVFPAAGTTTAATNIPAPSASQRGFYDYTNYGTGAINIINAGAGNVAYTGTGYTSESGGTIVQEFTEKYPAGGQTPRTLSMIVGNQVEGVAANQAIAATIAKSHAETTGDLAYYKFLPNLSNGNPNNDNLGFFDYGHLDSNPRTTVDNGRESPVGLAVNWQNKQFLSGDIHWDSTNSGMNRDGVIAFGDVASVKGKTVFDGQGYSTMQTDSLLPVAGISNVDIGQQSALYRNPGTSGEIEALLLTAQATDKGGKLIGDPIYQPAFRVDASSDARLQAIDESSRGTTATPVTNYQGFSGGIMVRQDSGGGAATHILQSVNISDVNVHTNNTNDTAGAELKLHDVTAQPWSPSAAQNRNVMEVDFGSNATAHQGDSVYLSNDLYAAQHANTAYTVYPDDGTSASTTTVVGGTQNNNGFLVNATAINDLTVPQRCTTCDFVHWGVWSTDVAHPGAAAPVDHATLIPYVAGTVSQVANIPAMVGGLTAVDYTGPVYGQYFDASANGGQGSLTRQTGDFTANINLATRNMDSFHANFAGLSINNVGAPAHIGTAGPAAIIDPFQIYAGGSTYGTANGALFGPHAENIGGNFALSDTAHQKEAAGVFIGAR